MEKKTGYGDLLTQKDYLKMIVANMINRLGDSIDSIAFTWLVYAITGNAVWSAVVFGANQLPTILLQPFTGVLVERWKKKRLMVLTDLIRGMVVVGFAALYLLKLLNPWLMVLFTLVISTAEAFRVPAGLAFVPKILDRKLYEFGTGLNAGISTVMQLIGLAAAGIIIGRFGIQTAILIDAATYFLSAAILSLIRFREPLGIREKPEISGYVQELKEGFEYIKGKRVIMNFCVLAFALNGLLTPLNAFMAPLVVEVLEKGTEFMSFVSISVLVGMGAASFLYPYIQKKCNPSRLVLWSGGVLAISYLGFPAAGMLREQEAAVSVLSLICGAAMGASCGLMSSVLGVEFMKAVDQEYMARCGGVFNSLGSAATPAVSAICSMLALFCPVSVIFVACGCLCVILCIYAAAKKMKFEAPREASEQSDGQYDYI